MDTIPRELCVHILNYLSPKERSFVCSVSNIFKSTILEILELKIKHSGTYSDYHLFARSKNRRNFNLQFACNSNDIDLVNLIISKLSVLNTCDWNRGLRAACYHGNLSFVKLMIEKGANDWNGGMYDACIENHDSVINLMINKGANNWNTCFGRACYCGHPTLIKLFIEKGADDWNHGLLNACRGRNTEIIELMISKGATDLHGGFYMACKKGNLDIIQLMRNKIGYMDKLEYNFGLYHACFSGNLQIIELMIENGANDWNNALWNACSGGNLDAVKLMIEKGANYWNGGLINACYGGNIDIIETLLNKGADDFGSAFYNSCLSGYLPAVKLFMSKFDFTDVELNRKRWKNGMFDARNGGGYDVVDFLVDCTEFHLERVDWNDCLSRACSIKDQYMVDLLINKGANTCICGKSIKEHILII